MRIIFGQIEFEILYVQYAEELNVQVWRERGRSVTKEKHKSIGSGEIPKGDSEGLWEGERWPGEHLHFKGKESAKERERRPV